MKVAHAHYAATCLAGAALLFVAAPRASAEQRLYRVLDLGTLPGGHPSRPFGINDDGAVVGQANAGAELHAFVWLPAPLYSFSCPGLYDLHVLAPATPAGDSTAYEINTAGAEARIAGQAGGDKSDAFVWTVVNDTATPLNLSTFSGGGILSTTAAWAINDASSAVVVGDAEVWAECQGVPFIATIGFRTTLNGSGTLVALEPYGDDYISFARDVSTASPDDVVGYSDDETPVLQCIGTALCDRERDALVWATPSAPTSLAKIDPSWGAQALGNNNAGDIVGSSYDFDGIINCVRNATLWTAQTHELVILGDQPPLGAASATIANAVNDGSELHIVGRNASTERALLWQENAGGGWEDVLDLDAAACDCENDFILIEAQDLNDSGWIVVRGRLTSGGPDRAYLLRSVDDCPADLNGDGQVAVNDFLILLANWTDPGETCVDCDDLCCECNGDIDRDCMIGVVDFYAMLAAWGPCPGFGAPCGQGAAASGSGLSLEDAVQQLGFANVAGLQTWLAAADPYEAYGTAQLLAVLLSE